MKAKRRMVKKKMSLDNVKLKVNFWYFVWVSKCGHFGGSGHISNAVQLGFHSEFSCFTLFPLLSYCKLSIGHPLISNAGHFCHFIWGYRHKSHCKLYTRLLPIKFSLSFLSRKLTKKKCNWNAIACVVNTTYHRLLVAFFCHWKTFRCFFCAASSTNAHFFHCGFDCCCDSSPLFFPLFELSIHFFLICLDRFFFLHRSHRTTWWVCIYMNIVYIFFSEQRILRSFFFDSCRTCLQCLNLIAFFYYFFSFMASSRFFYAISSIWTFVLVARTYYTH